MNMQLQILAAGAEIPVQMIVIGVLILGAYLGGQIARAFKLAAVTGQMLGGMLLSPHCLSMLGIISPADSSYHSALGAFHFFVFVYLCMIAFGIGEELHLSRLKQVGKSALFISVVHMVVTFALTAGALMLCGLSMLDALLIGSIGVTSAPAITFVLMNQMRIEGQLRRIAGSVLVITDLAGVLLFSILVQIGLGDAKSQQGAGGTAQQGPGLLEVLLPVARDFFFAIAIGAGMYFLLRYLVHSQAQQKTPEANSAQSTSRGSFLKNVLAAKPSPSVELLLITVAVISAGTGLAYLLHLPFLVTAIVAGFLVANFHTFAVFDALKIGNIAAMLNLGFFALVGATMSLSVGDSHTMLLAGVYIATRFAGKMLGTFLGCKIAGQDAPITKTLPSQLIPQTGVAAVEAVYVAGVLGKPELAGIILPGIVVFGVLGVIQVERTLGKFKKSQEELAPARSNPAGHSIAAAARTLIGRLSPEAVLIDLEAETKSQAIREMVTHSAQISDSHIDIEQAIQVVSERESIMPTGFANRVAIPHGRLIGLDSSQLIVAKSREGIVFGGVDNSPCHLIFLVLSSGRGAADHLKMMGAISHVLSEHRICQKLACAESTADFLQILVDIAQHRDDEIEQKIARRAQKIPIFRKEQVQCKNLSTHQLTDSK